MNFFYISIFNYNKKILYSWSGMCYISQHELSLTRTSQHPGRWKWCQWYKSLSGSVRMSIVFCIISIILHQMQKNTWLWIFHILQRSVVYPSEDLSLTREVWGKVEYLIRNWPIQSKNCLSGSPSCSSAPTTTTTTTTTRTSDWDMCESIHEASCELSVSNVIEFHHPTSLGEWQVKRFASLKYN